MGGTTTLKTSAELLAKTPTKTITDNPDSLTLAIVPKQCGTAEVLPLTLHSPAVSLTGHIDPVDHNLVSRGRCHQYRKTAMNTSAWLRIRTG